MGSRNRLTYSWRLFAGLLVYSVVLVGCFAIFQYHREGQFKARELNTRLQLINTYLLSELGKGTDISEVDLADFHPFAGLRISVINPNGAVVYDNSADTLAESNHLDREEIRQALADKTGYTVRRHSRTTGGYYFYSAQQGDNGLIVRTAVPYSVALNALLKAEYTFLWVTGAIALLMCVIGYFATRRLGQHISRLNLFAENVEKGARISDTEPFPDDELGSISNHIVRLYARLQQANAARDSEHRAALHEQREKERIKKQLTDNINHELKTPVASVRVCVETLLEHDNLDAARRRKFLERALGSITRLERLLVDVSLITRMDDGRRTILREPLDLTALIAGVVESKTPAASAAGLIIDNRVVGPLELTGNQSMLEAIFNNLIDNAIAYSGASRLVIEAPDTDCGKIFLRVADNGAGVGAEHLPHLFERFYRIDKGRSRAAGGTGLGLAIVKNAVMLHGGSIVAENVPGGGLAFTLSLSRRSDFIK